MGRKPRIEYEGAMYHVIHRGNNREYIFEKPEDKQFLLDKINEIKKSMALVILGYVIMSNHYHLLLKTDKTPLSVVMHRINNAYSRYYNKKYKQTGHVFEGRYKATLIMDDKYLLSALRYIHNNPVRAGMVQQMADYPWSSDNDYRNNFNYFVDIDLALNVLSENRQAAIKKYVEFMESADSSEASFENVRALEEIPKEIMSKLGTEKRPTLDDILHLTGADERVMELLKNGSRKRNLTPYKLEYVKLAQREGYTLKEIAQHICCTPTAIINLLSRARH